jgi:hypothetical protein
VEGQSRRRHDPGGGHIQEREVHRQEENHHHRGLVDFGIVVEESFWHEEYVTESTIMIEKIWVRVSQEVSHSDRKLSMQSVMQKSARKKQHKFREGNLVEIKEDEPGIWAGFKVWAEVAMLVYMMKMENRLNVKDNDMVMVFKMEYTTAGMQKKRTVKEDIYMSVEVVRTAIVEVVRTAITKKEYNTAGIETNLTVKKRDVNMFDGIRMRNVDMVKFMVMVKEVFYNMIEETNTGIVVNFKSVEVVGTVIIVGKMNIMIEGYVMQKEKLTVQGGDINKFEAIHMMDAVIIKFVEVVINEEEYNMAEVYEELTVEEGDIYMFEDIHMRNVNNVKFMEVADMIILQYVEVVKKEKGTKKQEDFWSFRDKGDKTLSYLGGLGR